MNVFTPPQILLDEHHPALDRTGLRYREFKSDLSLIRYYTMLLIQKAPLVIRELNLLEQQISEIIKNAVKHGNKCDKNKQVKVWYRFTQWQAHIIIEDEGEGFKDLEKWNDFNVQRAACLAGDDFEQMFKYASWRSETSDESDGGNALFAAVEYWNGGYVFNSSRNTVGAIKNFPQTHYDLPVL